MPRGRRLWAEGGTRCRRPAGRPDTAAVPAPPLRGRAPASTLRKPAVGNQKTKKRRAQTIWGDGGRRLTWGVSKDGADGPSRSRGGRGIGREGLLPRATSPPRRGGATKHRVHSLRAAPSPPPPPPKTSSTSPPQRPCQRAKRQTGATRREGGRDNGRACPPPMAVADAAATPHCDGGCASGKGKGTGALQRRLPPPSAPNSPPPPLHPPSSSNSGDEPVGARRRSRPPVLWLAAPSSGGSAACAPGSAYTAVGDRPAARCGRRNGSGRRQHGQARGRAGTGRAGHQSGSGRGGGGGRRGREAWGPPTGKYPVPLTAAPTSSAPSPHLLRSLIPTKTPVPPYPPIPVTFRLSTPPRSHT